MKTATPKKKEVTSKQGKQAPALKAKRVAVDWERIERDWRAGIKSVLQIAADYGKATGQSVSHTAINKHFKQLNVPRDLKAKVKAKAEAMVSAATVSGTVSTETTATDAAIIEANADVMATVMVSHRKDVGKGRALTMKLLQELEGQCDNPDLLEQLASILTAPDPDGDSEAAARRKERMYEQFNRAVSLGGRVDTMKKLADSLKSLVELERKVYGIGDDSKGGGTLEDFLDDL